MAERRMFAKAIVLSDAFMDLPMSARCLYYTLSMYADDDGFVNGAKGIMRQVGASQDDLHILIAKRFLYAFDDGLVCIKHWRINNYIQKDRYKPTTYLDARSTLFIDNNGAYTDKPVNASTVTEESYGTYQNVRLTSEEYNKLKEEFFDADDKINRLSEYMKIKGVHYESHYAVIIKWAREDKQKVGCSSFDEDAFIAAALSRSM